jgi:hypothetical protein
MRAIKGMAHLGCSRFIGRTYAQVTENEPQRSQCVGRVPRLVPLRGSKLRAASPTGEATGATQSSRKNESLRGFLRKSYKKVNFILIGSQPLDGVGKANSILL